MRPTHVELGERVVAARISEGKFMGQIAERFKHTQGHGLEYSQVLSGFGFGGAEA